MSSKLNHVIGSRVRAARDAAGLTQEQLAERVDRTKEAISNVERGVNLPTIETLDRICDVLGVRIRDMFGDAEGSPRKVQVEARIDQLLTGLPVLDLEMIEDIISSIKKHRSLG